MDYFFFIVFFCSFVLHVLSLNVLVLFISSTLVFSLFDKVLTITER